MIFQKAASTVLVGSIAASFIHDVTASEFRRNLQATFSLSELATGDSASSCWLGIDGMVLDVTDYADSHPVGAASVLNRCGQEISSAYYSVSSHSPVLLQVSAGVEIKGSLQVTERELSTHNSVTSCWLGIDGFAFDVTKYIDSHPLGPNSVLARCGEEITKDYFKIPSHSASLLENNNAIHSVGELAIAGPDPTVAPAPPPTPPPVPPPTPSLLNPTIAPVPAPTTKPLADPTLAPALAPTDIPASNPTQAPAQAPTKQPAADPTLAPNPAPTPMLQPTNAPMTPPTIILDDPVATNEPAPTLTLTTNPRPTKPQTGKGCTRRRGLTWSLRNSRHERPMGKKGKGKKSGDDGDDAGDDYEVLCDDQESSSSDSADEFSGDFLRGSWFWE